MKPLFENLATELENTTFSYQDYYNPNLPMTIYSMETNYKGNSIRTKNEFGNHNLGNIDLILNDKKLPEFEVTSTNHFVNLFLRKKEMLTVESRNITFKKFVEKKLRESNLQQIAKENSFEPRITNKHIHFDSHINTLYHLQFSDKIGAIKAIINFYKHLIEYQ